MSEGPPEVERVRNALDRLVRVAGLTYADVDKRLAEGRGFTTRVLHGVVGLKLEHIIAILKVLEIHPGDFFRLLFPRPASQSGGSSIARLLRLIQDPEPAEEPSNPDVESLARRIAELLKKESGQG